jgi:hypothetical protein
MKGKQIHVAMCAGFGHPHEHSCVSAFTVQQVWWCGTVGWLTGWQSRMGTMGCMASVRCLRSLQMRVA